MTTLAPDPAVPRRDLLLDGATVGRRIAASLTADRSLVPQRCQRLRSKYRVGESLRVVYRLDAGERSYTLAARSFDPAAGERAYLNALASAVPCGPLRPVVHLPELGAVFWIYPNDRKIANLPVLTGAAPLNGLLDNACARTSLVAYAPETSATARCLDGAGRLLAYAKVHAGDGGGRACEAHETLTRSADGDGDALRLPRALAYSPAWRTLVLEAVPGRPLADLGGAALAAGVERMGTALAELHELPAPPSAPPFERLTPARLDTGAQVIARARPDAAQLAAELAERLRERASGIAAEPAVCLHGDPHPSNALLDGARIALVDLEHIATGPPSADLARVIAGLRLQRVVGELSPTAESALSERLLRGYAAVRPLPEAASLRWHTAASLLARCAVPAVGRLRPRALDHLRALLVDAKELVR